MVELIIGSIGCIFLFFEFIAAIIALIIFRNYEKKNS
jgi:hypothetical protein